MSPARAQKSLVCACVCGEIMLHDMPCKTIHSTEASRLHRLSDQQKRSALLVTSPKGASIHTHSEEPRPETYITHQPQQHHQLRDIDLSPQNRASVLEPAWDTYTTHISKSSGVDCSRIEIKSFTVFFLPLLLRLFFYYMLILLLRLFLSLRRLCKLITGFLTLKHTYSCVDFVLHRSAQLELDATPTAAVSISVCSML